MRIWEGIEKEGAQIGVKTLFVESALIFASDLPKIKDVAKKRGISRIYLGAGKIDVGFLCKEWPVILNEYNVVIETTPYGVKFLSNIDCFQSVVIRNDLNISDYKNIVPKIDNGSVVAMYYQRIENSTETAKEGMYSDTDKIIEL